MRLVVLLVLLVACDAPPGTTEADGGGRDAAPDVPRAALDGEVNAVPPDAFVPPQPDAEAPDVPLDLAAPDLRVPDANPQAPDAAPPDAAPDAQAARDAAADVALDGPLEPDVGEPLLPDLFVLEDRLLDSVWFDTRVFAPGACEIDEGCVGAAGRRRLLRFGLSTANGGEGDFRMGSPADNPLFGWSQCRERPQFDEYARYGLTSEAGEVVATGHKAAYCLLDSGRFDHDDATVRELGHYQCGSQGISRGWYDTYGSGLDCQWIDITGVDPGDYTLRVEVNFAEVVPESSFENNTSDIPLAIPVDDIRAECPEDAIAGRRRSCGWSVLKVGACARGEELSIGCSEACGLGACRGDPMLRVCEGQEVQCGYSSALASASDSCQSECPWLEFPCPLSGAYSVWVAAERVLPDGACELATEVRVRPPPTDPCDRPERTAERECGWQVEAEPRPCEPGLAYRVGCSGGPDCGLAGVEVACEGDPVLRVCPGDLPCRDGEALARDDADRDECRTLCPLADFVCGPSGQFTVMTGAYIDGQPYRCDVGVVRDGL